MQLLEHWDPLSLPRGSIRAIIALALLGLLSYFLLKDLEAPLSLAFVSLLVLGHYFGARAGRSEYGGRPPLFLPRGSIRIIMIGLLLTVTWFMWEDDRLDIDLQERETTVMLVALGLIAGYVIRAGLDIVTGGRMAKPRRLFENVKAILALMATATLIIACINSDLPQSENIALLVTPFIAFYYGSRQGWQDGRPAARVDVAPAAPAPSPPRASESPAPPAAAPPPEPPTVKAEHTPASEA